ncbi:oligosaccharyl transferase subunit ost3/OST6 [Coemansia javaensis]|uniref:Oligosaccharyl transferase subunit ost3/OST6 n=1 Tax=Coemansia javaensis TaxID=2761396 RepID=A0A9W8H713_9FUNG|nr:oligosaccharyl transferase subunit ost3/OST6 [Coemansia javaensis]
MRLLAALALALVLVLAGAAPSFDRLRELGGQDRDGVAVLQLDDFIKHVVREDRDYAVVVQLTALSPQYKCDTCHAVDRSVRAVARGWRRQQQQQGQQEQRKIVFASLDVEEGEDMFRKMGIDKIPRLMIFPAAKGPHAMANPTAREMKLSPSNARPEGMAARLAELLGAPIRADVPTDYTKYATTAAAVAGASYAVVLAYRHVDLRRLGRNAWAVATITFVLLMTSGFMWNRINAPPYMGQTRTGDAVLFAPTQNQQYGVETQIVASAYAACALCVVLLVRHVPRVSGPEQRTLVTLLVVASLVLMYSYINSVFRLKMPGYPYRLLLP